MGDISAEPSMEEILSSIKRIIAEEGEGLPPRTRRPQRAVLAAVPPADRTRDDAEEVLELSEPIPSPAPERPSADRIAPAPPGAHQPAPHPVAAAAPRAVDPIVSQQTAAASRGSLEALSRLVVRPDGATATDHTLEAMVREMLRPMLREWLDAKLPDMVEALVAREIERITGSPTS
ncbi:DUF2497 domain-containing protein [Sphingomonas sp.]|uniref:DUF2497 domain-containing protein n=1 Tax=Sphingomonas sp. TaxID=28214 RepID=UPI0035BC1895